jgi:NADP-dependent 3-hydroxy acid dehydrogenase YdfG
MNAPLDGSSLRDRTVLVVGAAGGVGAGVTRSLLEHGTHVVAASRRIEKLREFEKQIGGSGRAA